MVRSRTPEKVMSSERGYSLQELMIVVASMMIVMGVAVPLTTSSMRSMQVLSDGQKIASDLSLARLLATSKASRYEVLFDVAGNKWTMQKYDPATGSYQKEGASNTLSEGLFESGITLKSTSASAPSGFPTTASGFIRFNSRGIPVNAAGTPTGDNVVYLSGNETDYAVTVSLSGKVQRWKLRNAQWVAE